MAQTNEKTETFEQSTILAALPSIARESDILVMGPTLSEKDQVAFDILVDSWEDRNNPFVITANDPAPEFQSRFGAFVPAGRRPEDVYVIDCTEVTQDERSGQQSGCSVSSPVDLTGISVCLSKGYDTNGSTGGRRVLLDNLSTLLIYSDIDRIYRFISSINNHVSELGDATVQLLDTDAIDSTDKSKLVQLFSTIIEVRTDTDTTLFRVHGGERAKWTPWYEYQPLGGSLQ